MYSGNLKEYEGMAKEIIRKAQPIKQRPLGVNILAFADTHYELTRREDVERIYNKYSNPDLVVLLGDHHPMFVDLLLQYYDVQIIAAVLGNHDRDLYRNFGMKELHGDVKEINGLRIGGISGSHKYKCSNKYLLLTQEESIEICDILLEKPAVDILITHDKAFVEDIYDTAHCGLIGLTKYIYLSSKKGPVAHLHGHLHQSFCKDYKNHTKEISIYGVEYLNL